MTSVLHKYRLKCIEEDIYVYRWAETEPTICPNDHADRTIDSNLTSIVETIQINTVTAQENSDGDFTSQMFMNDIPSGTPGDITNHDDAIFDVNALLWKTIIYPTPDLVGDVINVRGIKMTFYNIVGVLIATANISDTILNVSSTVTDNVYKGMEVELDNGAGTTENVGVIKAIDTTPGSETITVKTPLTTSFAAGSMVRVEVVVMKDIPIITDKFPIIIDGKGFKGKNVDEGDVLRVKYKNNDGVAKKIYWRVEYYNKDSV